MPTQTYYREWCKCCNDFTIHRRPWKGEMICGKCETEFSDYYLKDIPEDKMLAQRARYSKSGQGSVLNFATKSFLAMAARTNPIEEMGLLDSDGGWGRNSRLVEADAGQYDIDQQALHEWKVKELLQRQERQRKQEEQNMLKTVGRNEQCPLCAKNGINIKFKKCPIHYH